MEILKYIIWYVLFLAAMIGLVALVIRLMKYGSVRSSEHPIDYDLKEYFKSKKLKEFEQLDQEYDRAIFYRDFLYQYKELQVSKNVVVFCIRLVLAMGLFGFPACNYFFFSGFSPLTVLVSCLLFLAVTIIGFNLSDQANHAISVVSSELQALKELVREFQPVK